MSGTRKKKQMFLVGRKSRWRIGDLDIVYMIIHRDTGHFESHDASGAVPFAGWRLDHSDAWVVEPAECAL